MKSHFIILIFGIIFTIFLTTSPAFGQRLYVRHRRSVEREGTPKKESTVVVASDKDDAESASEDLPEDLKPHVNESEKDCKDFFELDYNPRRDMFKFNGNLPNFHPYNDENQTGFHSHQQGMDNIQRLFQQMFRHASHMFNHFPRRHGPNAERDIESFPKNHNGTTTKIIDIDGRKFVKKTTVINKDIDGVQVHIMSTSYEQLKPETAETDSTTDSTVSSTTSDESVTSSGEREVESSSKTSDDQNEIEKKTDKPNDLTDGTVVSY